MTVTEGASVIDLVLQHQTSIYLLHPAHPNIGTYSFEATENICTNTNLLNRKDPSQMLHHPDETLLYCWDTTVYLN